MGAFGEGSLDFAQQFAPHFDSRRVVEPVQKPAASGRFTKPLIRFEAQAGEELFNLTDRFQLFALPAAEAEGTGGFDGPILHAHEWWRGGCAALRQPWVVAAEGIAECFQAGC